MSGGGGGGGGVALSVSRCTAPSPWCCSLRLPPLYSSFVIVPHQHQSHAFSFVSSSFTPSSITPPRKSRTTRSRSRSSCSCSRERETPYEVLGVGPSASAQEIKRAYRRLALRFHPDVNKEPHAQERFMRIKHAYNTLINSSHHSSSSSSSSTAHRQPQSQSQSQEDFYGLADFLRDLQEEYRNWEADFNAQEKPKSLWEELSAIGEEFVEFLEKELYVKDPYVESDSMGSPKEKRQERQPTVEESIDEVEAALAQLKKELGL